MTDRFDHSPDRDRERHDRRPAPRDHKVEQMLTEHGLAPRPAPIPLRGPMHAKGGWQILCVTSDIQFARRVARATDGLDAHPAVVWGLEDLERLPFWMFHGVIVDEVLQREITARASARVRRHLEELPMAVTSGEQCEPAVRHLVGSLTMSGSAP